MVSIHRLACFRRALSQLSYTTMGPAPGLEPGSTGLQSQCPSCRARPALFARRRSRRILRRRSVIGLHQGQSTYAGRRSLRYGGQVRRVVGRCRCPVLGNDESQPIASHGARLLSSGSGGRCRTLISRIKTLRPAIGRLPSGWWVEGSMGTAPITRGWKPRVYLSTP